MSKPFSGFIANDLSLLWKNLAKETQFGEFDNEVRNFVVAYALLVPLY